MPGYCTIADLALRYGTANLAMWSGVDGSSSDPLNATRQQNACDWAFNQINALLTRGPYTLPLVFIDVYSQGMVQEWAIELAVWHLYTARGINDEDKTAGKFEETRNKVMAEIKLVRAGSIQLNAARRWGDNPNSPTII